MMMMMMMMEWHSSGSHNLVRSAGNAAMVLSRADQGSAQGVCLVPRPHGFPRHYYWLNMAKKRQARESRNPSQTLRRKKTVAPNRIMQTKRPTIMDSARNIPKQKQENT